MENSDCMNKIEKSDSWVEQTARTPTGKTSLSIEQIFIAEG